MAPIGTILIKHKCKQCGLEIPIPAYVIISVIECPQCKFRDLVLTHEPIKKEKETTKE